MDQFRPTIVRAYDGPYAFVGPHGREGHCYLQIYEPRGGDLPVVLAVETADNEGPSITHAQPALATGVWRQLLPHAIEGLRWIELYLDTYHRDVAPAERFAEVIFDLAGDTLRTPRWRHIERADVEALIGGPVSVPIGSSY